VVGFQSDVLASPESDCVISSGKSDFYPRDLYWPSIKMVPLVLIDRWAAEYNAKARSADQPQFKDASSFR
jgi:hypothetical protein